MRGSGQYKHDFKKFSLDSCDEQQQQLRDQLQLCEQLCKQKKRGSNRGSRGRSHLFNAQLFHKDKMRTNELHAALDTPVAANESLQAEAEELL